MATTGHSPAPHGNPPPRCSSPAAAARSAGGCTSEGAAQRSGSPGRSFAYGAAEGTKRGEVIRSNRPGGAVKLQLAIRRHPGIGWTIDVVDMPDQGDGLPRMDRQSNFRWLLSRPGGEA